MALDIKRELKAVDLKDYDFYDKLTPEEIEELKEAVFDAISTKKGSLLPHNRCVLQ